MVVLAILLDLAAQLVAQPAFWYCVVALVCANIIANSIRRGLRAHAVVLRRRRYVADDGDGDADFDALPRAEGLIPTHLDEQAFDRAASRAE